MTEKLLAEALQDVWNDHCGDTGCVPPCFEIHGPGTTRVSANFVGSQFVQEVVKRAVALGELEVKPNRNIKAPEYRTINEGYVK